MHPISQSSEKLQIPSSGITLLEGPGFFGKDIRVVVQNWTALFLSQGHVVHWIDGGHRFDPCGFFPAMRSLNCSIEESLRRLYIGRGFTLHQLHALIERVQHEVALTKASIIVVDGMMAMFLDEQIKSFESRSIMRHCLACLENVSQHCTVVVLDGRTTSPLHKQLKHTMRPYLKQKLEGRWVDRKQRRLHISGNQEHYLLDVQPVDYQTTLHALNGITPNDLSEEMID